MVNFLICLALATLAWLGAWAAWPISRAAAGFLACLGGMAAATAVLALVWSP